MITNVALGDEFTIKSATAELTADEIAFILTIIGKHSPRSAEEVLPGVGPRALKTAYDGLAGLVNSFYDDGVHELVRSLA